MKNQLILTFPTEQEAKEAANYLIRFVKDGAPLYMGLTRSALEKALLSHDGRTIEMPKNSVE